MQQMHTISGSKLVRFTSGNYNKIFLSPVCTIIEFDDGIGVRFSFDEAYFMIPDAKRDLFDIFLQLVDGLALEDLLRILPMYISDKEEFVAELWQKGVIL